jgi:CheY-like chemotaxis protein
MTLMTPGMAASWNGHWPPRPYPDLVVLRCLIVDDNPGFLRAARALLEQEGLRVIGVASTGEEAVRRAADLRPDVTLLDVDLGADSGFDVARRLFDDPAVDPGQLILISAHAQDDFADLIEASPAVGFLVKQALSATAIETLLQPPGDCRDRAGETAGR